MTWTPMINEKSKEEKIEAALVKASVREFPGEKVVISKSLYEEIKNLIKE